MSTQKNNSGDISDPPVCEIFGTASRVIATKTVWMCGEQELGSNKSIEVIIEISDKEGESFSDGFIEYFYRQEAKLCWFEYNDIEIKGLFYLTETSMEEHSEITRLTFTSYGEIQTSEELSFRVVMCHV